MENLMKEKNSTKRGVKYREEQLRLDRKPKQMYVNEVEFGQLKSHLAELRKSS